MNVFFNELVRREIIAKNPAKGLKKLPTRGIQNIPYTDDQMKRLGIWLKHNDPELFIFTQFIYFTFARPAELVRLQIKDINLKQGIILIMTHQSKNKKQLPVTIPKKLKTIIEGMNLSQYPHGFYLFSKLLLPGPEPIKRRYATDRHTRALKRSGVYDGHVTMYSWKHTGNCNAYRAGADIKALQAQNRHSSLEMTDQYLGSLGLRQQYQLRNLDW